MGEDTRQIVLSGMNTCTCSGGIKEGKNTSAPPEKLGLNKAQPNNIWCYTFLFVLFITCIRLLRHCNISGDVKKLVTNLWQWYWHYGVFVPHSGTGRRTVTLLVPHCHCGLVKIWSELHFCVSIFCYWCMRGDVCRGQSGLGQTSMWVYAAHEEGQAQFVGRGGVAVHMLGEHMKDGLGMAQDVQQ